MNKQLELYDRYKFRYIPVNGKIPYFKKWNEVTHSVEIPTGKNVGILTGKPSKITVLDIDSKDNGLKVWNILSSLYPHFVTPTVATPSGLHLYFKYNKKLKSTSRLKVNDTRIGWDILNNDRQCVAPPSVADNKKYRWKVDLSNPIITMPLWIESYILLNK